MSIQFSNNEREVINTQQEIFDNFNQFIFSSDTKVFAKLVARTMFFNEVKDRRLNQPLLGAFQEEGSN